LPSKEDYLYQIPRIYDGLEYLLGSDKVFSSLSLSPKDIKREYTGPGFAGLVRIVIGQQVSTQAASALWKKFCEAVPSVTPNAVMLLGPDELRDIGLSHQKAGYIKGLAGQVIEGSLDPGGMEGLSDKQIYKNITALKGFGEWSAEMFLIFGLARPDVFPAGDLGIQEGLRRYHGLDKRPDEERSLAYGQAFKPYRTAAALLLWHLKSLDD
jgi:DNA-3-methyladenine glycosylase II